LGQSGSTTKVNPSSTPVEKQATVGESGQHSKLSNIQAESGENATIQNSTGLGQSGVGTTKVSPSSTPVEKQAMVGESGQHSKLSNIQAESGENATIQNSTGLGQSGSTTQVSPSSKPVEKQATVGESGQHSNVSVVPNKESMNITLPSNGLYTIHTEPSSRYLVETDSRFTNYNNFITSDYMLQRLGLDPAKTMKQIGDGFYQQKLIRDQISQLTGKQLLSDYSSAEDEYKALMNNGTTYAKQFNLQLGVALTAAQMAQLTSNMVWMVEQEVQGQKVLVPVVYLAPNQTNSLRSNGAIITADNVQITTDQDILNQNSKITGGSVKLVAGRDIKNETTTYVAKTGENLNYANNIRTMAGQTAEISATGNLALDAKRDVIITGGNLAAGENITLDAGRNINISAVATNDRTTAKDYLKDTTTNITSSIKAGGNITMISQQDANLTSVQVDAGQNLTLKSLSGNINITAVKDEEILDKKVGTSKNWKRTSTDDETVIGSTLKAGGNVNLMAVNTKNSNSSGNITIAGSTIYSADGKISIDADKDVTVQELTEKHESLVQTHKKKSGFLSSKTKDTRDYSLVNEVKGSTISGGSVEIISGQDLSIKGSNLVATNDVNLEAANDVNIVSAQETGKEEHYSRTKKSGLFSGGGLGFTIGTQSKTSTLNEQVLGEIGSTIGSINGNISITAGKIVDSAGTTFISGKDTNITGKDVTIDNTINTYDSQYKYEFKQSGLTVSLGGGVVNTVSDLAGNLEQAGEVKDERLKVLYETKALKDLKTLGNKLKGNPADGFSINVSIGSTKITSEQNTHVETVNMSNITAGGNVTIKATTGNVNLKAVNINATDVTLDAKKDLNIESAQNKEQTTSKTNSSSGAIGASFGLSGSFGGFTGSASSSKGKENETIGTYAESIIKASGIATLKSGNDTNIIGSQVKGEKVVIDVGGNLNIASQQDTDDYNAKNQSSGIGFSTGQVASNKVASGGVTGSISKGKTDSTYASVTNQAGIFAGKGGFDITVGKNTDLKGAVIASEATPDKNKISTDTLTYSDIQNKAEYSASSTGVSLDTKGKIPVTPVPGMSVSGDADSTTKSAIATGTIEVRSNPNQDLSTLSRDTTGALNALDKIFDKKTVQEKQELSKVFGEVAFEAIGDLALSQYKKALKDASNYKEGTAEYKEAMARAASWDEGGSNKILLHAVAGGIISDLGGNGFTSGAVGAGVNEAVQKELSNIKDPGFHQLASALIGGVAAKIVGGSASVGASVAASATKNNFLNHDQQMAFAKALSEAKTDEEKANIVAYYAAMSQFNVEQNARQGNLSDPEIIEPALLSQLKWITDNTNNGLNYSLQDLSSNIYGTNNSYAYYKNQLDSNNVSNINNPFNVKLDNDNNNYKADPIPGNIADRIQNQTPPTDPNVQKANELIAAGAQVVASPDGTKNVREWHADGTFQDYYLPNQNVAVTPSITSQPSTESTIEANNSTDNNGSLKGALKTIPINDNSKISLGIGEVSAGANYSSKNGLQANLGGYGSVFQFQTTSGQIGQNNLGGSENANITAGFAGANVFNIKANTTDGISLSSKAEFGLAKAKANFEFNVGDYSLVVSPGGSVFTIGYKAEFKLTPTSVKFGAGWSPGVVGGEVTVEVKKNEKVVDSSK
jgi:filamentous hemagglutinin